MTDDVKLEVIKKTQDLLGKYFKKPPLTEKLLKKPPFRFLHDVISAVIKETGFLKGLFTTDELNSENIKDKEAKLAYLTKLVDVIKLISGANLTVRPSKIIAGQEPTKTNELLQAIGKALDKKVKSDEAIEHYKKNLEKRGKTSTKSKPTFREDGKKTTARQLSQTRKPTEKEASVLGQKKRSSSTGKITTKEKEMKNSEKKDSTRDLLLEETNNIPDIIDIPPAEPVQGKVPITVQGKKHISSVTSMQNNLTPITSMELENSDITSSDMTADKKVDEPLRQKESAIKKKQKHYQASELEDLLSAKSKSTDNKSKNGAGSSNDIKEFKETEISVNNELSQQTNEKRITSAEQLRKQTDIEQSPSRPKTSLRPPSARPISARPAAPRLRTKTELIVNEEIITPMGNISVIVENSDAKDDDDDAEDMVVVETKESIEDSLLNSSNHKMDVQLTQEHGHLVAQILETQRELVNTDNIDILPKMTDIAWESGSRRDREVITKEVEKLRTTIQTLTRATNPLGKLLDYLQEDVEMMLKELLDWRNQYNQLSEQLEKEQTQTQNLIEPMKETLKEIDNNMKDQLDKICQAKARIIKNDQKIHRLLNDNI